MNKNTVTWPVRLFKMKHTNGYMERVLILFSIKTQRGHDTLYYINSKGERETVRIDNISFYTAKEEFFPVYKILKEFPPAIVIGDKDDWDLFQNRNVLDMDFRAFPLSAFIRTKGMDEAIAQWGDEVKVVGGGTSWRLK